MIQIDDLEVETLDGRLVSLGTYKGKLLLIVNTASRCGFTPQYRGLQELFESYRERGLVVLGFPCNQFGAQEPGDEASIAQFCDLNYGVSFPMFAKIDVNGEHAHPLFVRLKKAAPGLLGTEAIKWNFTKFLVTPDGKVKRYAPTDTPEAIEKDILRALEQSSD